MLKCEKCGMTTGTLVGRVCLRCGYQALPWLERILYRLRLRRLRRWFKER